jgi:hypothetical protein
MIQCRLVSEKLACIFNARPDKPHSLQLNEVFSAKLNERERFGQL